MQFVLQPAVLPRVHTYDTVSLIFVGDKFFCRRLVNQNTPSVSV